MKNNIGNCPICDSKSMKILINGRDGIGCTECGLMYRPESADETWEETVKHWNTRKPLEKIVERLEKLKAEAFDDEVVVLNDAIEIVKGGIINE